MIDLCPTTSRRYSKLFSMVDCKRLKHCVCLPRGNDLLRVSFPIEPEQGTIGAGVQRKKKMVSSCSVVRGLYLSHSLVQNLIHVKVNSEALV